jgi:hypothetical protein
MKVIFLTCAFVASASPMFAQSFSCSYGKQPACLDYSDKVCSSYSKCVSQDAACFESYQCNYEGFTCKSNVRECVEEHDALVRKYNTLLNEHDTLIFDYNALLAKATKAVRSHDDLKDCLTYASDMDAVRICLIY